MKWLDLPHDYRSVEQCASGACWGQLRTKDKAHVVGDVGLIARRECGGFQDPIHGTHDVGLMRSRLNLATSPRLSVDLTLTVDER